MISINYLYNNVFLGGDCLQIRTSVLKKCRLSVTVQIRIRESIHPDNDVSEGYKKGIDEI